MKRFTVFAFVALISACSVNSLGEPIATSIPVPSQTIPPTSTLTPTPTITPIPSSTRMPYNLPGPVVPDGLGVNIHFLNAEKTELDLLTRGGFKFVRMDFNWESVEYIKGIYDFSAYDNLVALMEKRDIRIIFILDYGNPFYDDGLAPYTNDGRMAFAQFAASAATRYKSRGILWEIWNEPDFNQFWKPQPNVQDYALLADITIDAIKHADQNAFVVGPAACCSGWNFIEQLGQLGVLNKFDAITIHPYGAITPESAQKDYLHVRQILDRYSPDRKIPIYVGERGYSDVWNDLGMDTQAKYLARSWLINMANEINLSIWYDWKDDCFDKTNIECHYGMTRYNGSLSPKPAYLAARTLISTLKGYRFERLIPDGNPQDYLLLFNNGKEVILVAWTTDTYHLTSLPLSGDTTRVISMLGVNRSLNLENGLTIEMSDSPQYLLLGTRSFP